MLWKKKGEEILEGMQFYIEQGGGSLTEMFDYIPHLTTSKKHTF